MTFVTCLLLSRLSMAAAAERGGQEFIPPPQIVFQQPHTDEKGQRYVWDLVITNGSRYQVRDIIVTTSTYSDIGEPIGVAHGTIPGGCQPFSVLSITNFEIRNVPANVDSFECKLDGFGFESPQGDPEAPPQLVAQPEVVAPRPSRETVQVAAPKRPKPVLSRESIKPLNRDTQLQALKKEQQQLSLSIEVKRSAKQSHLAEDRRMTALQKQIATLQTKLAAGPESNLAAQPSDGP